MYCKNCGRQLPEGTRFCDYCGENMTAAKGQPKPGVGFFEAVKLFFAGYVNFSGRARRSEFWWASLFTGILGGVIGASFPDIAGIWSLIILLPSISICFRRLHDIGKSGWWYFLGMIPLVGQIILLVWYCRDSEGANKWGPSPKY